MSRARTIPALFVILTVAGAAATSTPLDVPFFRQEKNGCGAAAVAMVAHYWGSRVGPPELPSPKQIYQRLYDAERRGIALAGMKRYLEELGYRAFTFRGERRDLEGHLSKGRPVIVSLKKKTSRGLHFAVLTGVEADHVWLNDPTRTRPSRVKQAEFENQWQSADRWVLLAAPANLQ